jgi:hypothetical protein
LLVEFFALALRALRLLGAQHDALEAMIAFAADEFKNRHGFKRLGLKFNSAPIINVPQLPSLRLVSLHLSAG